MISKDEALKKLETLPKLTRPDLVGLVKPLYDPAEDGESEQIYNRKHLRDHTNDLYAFVEGRLRAIAGIGAPAQAPVVRTPVPSAPEAPAAVAAPEVEGEKRRRRPRTPAKAPDATSEEPAVAAQGPVATVDLTPILTRLDAIGAEVDKINQKLEALTTRGTELNDMVDEVLANQKVFWAALTEQMLSLGALGPEDDLATLVPVDEQGNS